MLGINVLSMFVGSGKRCWKAKLLVSLFSPILTAFGYYMPYSARTIHQASGILSCNPLKNFKWPVVWFSFYKKGDWTSSTPVSSRNRRNRSRTQVCLPPEPLQWTATFAFLFQPCCAWVQERDKGDGMHWQVTLPLLCLWLQFCT